MSSNERIERIERIAKILAKATSTNNAEAELAIKSAFSRMKHDGVDFEDLLSLDKVLLSQETLPVLAGDAVENGI
jgi:hypothetical protein